MASDALIQRSGLHRGGWQHWAQSSQHRKKGALPLSANPCSKLLRPQAPKRFPRMFGKTRQVCKIKHFLEMSNLGTLGGVGSGVPNSSRETLRLSGYRGFGLQAYVNHVTCLALMAWVLRVMAVNVGNQRNPKYGCEVRLQPVWLS